MNPLESYLHNLSVIRSSGAAVKETSYYSSLDNLFNEIGKTLKPKVRCIINIANKGAGLPDGGFFTPDQFQKSAKGVVIEGQIPSRGCMEVKSTSHDIDARGNRTGTQVPRAVHRARADKSGRRSEGVAGLSGRVLQRHEASAMPEEVTTRVEPRGIEPLTS